MDDKKIAVNLDGLHLMLSEEKAKELIEDLSSEVYGISYKTMWAGRRVLFDRVEQIKDIVKDWEQG